MGVQLDLRPSLPFLDGNGCPKRPTRKPDPCLGGAVLGAVDVGEAWDSHTYSYIFCVAHCGLKQTHKPTPSKSSWGPLCSRGSRDSLCPQQGLPRLRHRPGVFPTLPVILS